MAAQLVQIEKDDRRASVVESTLSVWVGRGWKLVTESDPQPEAAEIEGEEAAQTEAKEADAGQQPAEDKPAEDKPAEAPLAKPAGAHQAPELTTRS